MVEFGEQLRRAREAKGMTQQSLAEQLFVTRQSVSRWECGDRYPDLLMTKKISQILEVSLDDLLSGKETSKVIDRNPVIEKKSANILMIVLYVLAVIFFLTTIADIIIRFPLLSKAIDYSDIQLIVINVLGILIQIICFSYGIFHVLRGTFSPKRMGVVIIAYFGAMCITASTNLSGYAAWQQLMAGAALILFSLLGAVSSFLFFIRGNNSKICLEIIYTASILGIFHIIYSNYRMVQSAGQYLSMNASINQILKISIYILILYQTHILGSKRNISIKVQNKKQKSPFKI